MRCLFALTMLIAAPAMSQQLPSSNAFDSLAPARFNIFPVPVGTLLNLEYTSREPINGVLTIVIHCLTTGVVFHRLRMASTTRLLQIPVGNLGRGVYEIRVWIGEKPAFSRKFVK